MGHPTDESDLDLLVVVESSEEKRYTRPVAGLLALFGLNISKDLMISTRDEFASAERHSRALYLVSPSGSLNRLISSAETV